MDYGHVALLIGGIIAVVLAALKIDPDRKYRDIAIKILTAVKDVTPDNVDMVIDLIKKGLKAEGKNPESKAAKEIISKVREEANLHGTDLHRAKKKGDRR